VVVRSFIAALVLAACTEDPELFVELRTDFVPEAEFVRVRTRVESDDGLVLEREAFGRYGEDYVRGQRIAEFAGLPLGRHLVRVELFSPWGAELSSRAVALDFHASRGITVVMTRTCAYTSCPGDADPPAATECYGGRCVSPECSSENPEACGEPACESDAECGTAAYCARSLCDEGVCLIATIAGACRATEWCDPAVGCVPRATLPDASVPDGGSSCTGDGMCDDGFDCTVDRCDDGTCRHLPDDAACTAGDMGMCIEGFGCQYAGCTPSTCIPTSGCERARCDGSECVLESACSAAEMCCGGACVAAGCDDGNPCTADACEPSGCTHVPASGPCADGVFCNGSDSCASGACTVHAGPPCPGASSCDEAADTCTGCSDDASCPADMVGPFSSCTYADGCAESGTQTRAVTSYECVSGTCAPSTRMESAACSRDTDSTSCGATTFGAWGSCAGFSGACDESGTWMRTRTDRQCGSGSCRDVASEETGACSRDTDGTSCGSPMYGGFGACGGFENVCDTSGAQTRTRTDYTCIAATCSPSSATETGSCTRGTDGVSCGGPSYSGWSDCTGFSDDCDESGTQTRVRTDPVCSGGGCGSVDTVESQACTRSTGGVVCGSPTFGSWGFCSFSDECDESGTQSRTRTDYLCGGGTCNASGSTETMGCSRDTDGSYCEDFPSCRRGTCAGGACSYGAGCSAGRRCCEPGICVCSTCACP
jgi:hypothetical protein